MMRKSNAYGNMGESSNKTTSSSSTSVEEKIEWEMRPGGMLVQKRSQNGDDVSSAPDIRLRVAYGAMRYEISVNSRATFGEVKKLVKAETGLEAGEQRVIFKGRERENGEYLDMCGVKDRSKVIVMEDPASIERRFIEMRRKAKIETSLRSIQDVSMEVDKLADQVNGWGEQSCSWEMIKYMDGMKIQVSAIEKSISNGVKVAEVQITTLIEMLMRQAIKLDNIAAEGDALTQKNLQGTRVQKCVETLDTLKISNARAKAVTVTTEWETFDPSPSLAQWEIFD